ncbi:MAG: hypothetical protein K9J16_07650 [Melioribacteraceae bacterium]|nr:hypothetical protein [Melioribacteraceae bacterium]MCF8353304.1 hypothetical protein [Melioribacteraceae bacterium]MCF8393168.1 hypothetical protein [Melioribacteraceae bacterium]MCF8419029.1 hypothetical protein [Melioribacteraceae bacterium]
MAEYQKHLYMIVFPINALVASQLEPDMFGEHYTTGSAKHFSGKMIFAELDINFRNDYFEIEDYLAKTAPHSDGGPKKTKFIKSYNVLEHVDLSAINKLFLCTSNGKVLPIEPADYNAYNEPGLIRIYQEITPLETLVASTKDQREFGKFITTETTSKGAPKMCFTQIDFNIQQFLQSNKNREIFQIDLPNVNPYRFYDCITELKDKPEKLTKTIGLGSLLRDISYKFLRHGFWFSSGEELKFFPMPSMSDMENKYFYWWKFVR